MPFVIPVKAGIQRTMSDAGSCGSPVLQTLGYVSAPKFERGTRAYDSRSCLRIRLGRRTHTANKIMNATAPSTNSIAVVTSGVSLSRGSRVGE